MTLAELEHGAIQQCLIETGGKRQQTAELLGISKRTLLRKIREYKLEDPLGPAAPVTAIPKGVRAVPISKRGQTPVGIGS